MNVSTKNGILFSALAALIALQLTARGAEFKAFEDATSIRVVASNYVIQIEKNGFRYGFGRPSGETIAPQHAVSGLEFGGSAAVETKFRSADAGHVALDVVNKTGGHAEVLIRPADNYVQFSVTSRGGKAGQIVARTDGVTPAFGLGDLGARKRDRTELTGYTNEDFQADGDQCGRLISNFVIFPRAGFAEVNVEPTTKIVRLTAGENAQGTLSAVKMPSLYYFFGAPQQIYADFLAVRDREDYRVFRPKYEWFGVGWEAFGALGWDTNEKTITQNIEHYLSLGYPLSWMVVGSGFWPRQSSNTLATTSFGMWDTNLYPHPKEFIEHFHRLGLKFMLGLRIAFITNGPFADEGVKGGYFLKENGAPKAFKIWFPKSPCYLLDAQNGTAVRWYVDLCEKWRSYGVDGFKEDLFGYGNYVFRDDKLDPVNTALMDRGFYVMGRNGYLGSPMDLHRYEDFNQDQNQDRGPINGLTFAYSGFPYVYPDIVGGTFGEGRKMPALTSPVMHAFMMRRAWYSAVNPSMAMGMGPWKFESDQVARVMLDSARLHARLQPYIYSAAVDAFETGFPRTLTPLPLLWPNDRAVYNRENTQVRGYEWMLGPSLLACPLYGDDHATAEMRDVYLPDGQWMDYDTGEIYQGPRLLKDFALPPEKTPLFVGGKGVVIEGSLNNDNLTAVVYPVVPANSTYRFTHADGTKRSEIVNEVTDWTATNLIVTDTTDGKPVVFEREPKTKAVRFPFTAGHNYKSSVGGK